MKTRKLLYVLYKKFCFYDHVIIYYNLYHLKTTPNKLLCYVLFFCLNWSASHSGNLGHFRNTLCKQLVIACLQFVVTKKTLSIKTFVFHNFFVFIFDFGENKTSSSLTLSSSNQNVMFSVFSEKTQWGIFFFVCVCVLIVV